MTVIDILISIRFLSEPIEHLAPGEVHHTLFFFNSGGGSCPSTHKFAYRNGNNCCATKKEKIDSVDGEKCDGSELQLDSSCCENDDHAPCPSTPCSDYDVNTANKCPSTHPFPYGNGNHCCATNKEKYDSGWGESCDGSELTLHSSCCDNDDHAPCPSKPCFYDYTKGPCPNTHPFVYHNGDKCCKTNTEANQNDQGDKCDSSELFHDSICCENNDSMPCEHHSCYDYGMSIDIS